MNILEYRRKALGYTYRADGDYDYSTPSANEAIRQMYIQNVGREPDAGGLAYFADRFGTDVSAKELADFRDMASAEVAAVEAQRNVEAQTRRDPAPTPPPPPATTPDPAPASDPRPGPAPAAPVTGTHRELRENQEGTYYVEVPNTQAYIDSENQKTAAATALATQKQADTSLQDKSQTFAQTFGGTPIYTGGDVAARLYQGDEVEAASYSPLALAGYFAPTGTKGYSHTYDAQGNYTGIVNTSPSGFINELSNSLAQLDSDLGLSKNAPLIVALAINVLAPGAGAAIGQSLVSSGLVTSASAASAAALAGGATAAGAAAAGAAATAFATTVGSTILNTGIQLATGVPVEKALTSAVLSVAGASFTPGISNVVQEVVGNETATKIITNAVVSAGKTAVTGGNIGDSFVTTLASGVANVGADKIISGLSINELPTAAVSVIKEGIVGTILTGDGTKAMTNAAINAGVTAAIDGFSNGIINLTEDAFDSLNNIVTSTDAATVDTDAINLQTATNAGFSDFATYMQYGGDLQAYNAATAGTTETAGTTGSTSGASGTSGNSGTSGTSGTDAASTAGTEGTSATADTAGTAGTAGTTAGTASTAETAGTTASTADTTAGGASTTVATGTEDAADTVSTTTGAADTIVSEAPAAETTADFNDLIAATGATTGNAVVADTATNIPTEVVDIAKAFPDYAVTSSAPTGALASVSENIDFNDASETPSGEAVVSAPLASVSETLQPINLPAIQSQEDAVISEADIPDVAKPLAKEEIEEQPIGGLNAVATEIPEQKVASSSGIKATDIAKPVISTIGNLIKSSLNRRSPAAPRPVGGLARVRPAAVKPPARMDVAKLIPIQKAVPIKKTVGPAKTLASTAKLSPVSNIAGLTSLVKKAG